MNIYTNAYRREKLQNFLIMFFGISACITPLLAIFLMTQPKQYIFEDSAGNYVVAIASELPDQKEIQMNCLKIATNTIFLRTKEGLLHESTRKQVFHKNLDEFFKKYLTDTQKEFEIKNIKQMMEINEAKVIHIEKDKYRAYVKGLLTQTCNYQGSVFVQQREFKIIMLMVENPDMRLNGMLPLVGYHFEKFEIGDLDLRREEVKK